MDHDALHCPHCHLGLEGWEPRLAARCPHCRLVIGAGRAIARVPGGLPGRAASAAAMLVLRDGDDGEVLAPGDVAEGLRAAARIGGVGVSELRMVDYAQLEQDGADVVPLRDVLATFGAWKPARAAAMRLAREARERDRAVV